MIQVLQPLPNRVLFSANNAIMTFRLTSGTPLKATIASLGISATIYPDVNGVFYFNFKEYVQALANQNNYRDTLVTNLPSQLTYTAENNYFLQALISIEDTNGDFTTTTVSRRVLAGALNLQNLQRDSVSTGQSFVCLPIVPKTNNTYFAKYWEGYPFDISLFVQEVEPSLTNESLPITPLEFLVPSPHMRLYFSDGRTDSTIEDVFSLIEGENNLLFNWGSRLDLVKVQNPCEGVYLKWWYNGGYVYWLFEQFFEQAQITSNIGEIESEPTNLEQSFGSETQIGKNAFERINLNSDYLTERESNLLSTLFLSPKVYYFTGTPNARNFVNSWIEVKVEGATNTLRNWKKQPNIFEFSITLPSQDTLLI
jgi:hypothetical protein